jgi:hypothetical protein
VLRVLELRVVWRRVVRRALVDAVRRVVRVDVVLFVWPEADRLLPN